MKIVLFTKDPRLKASRATAGKDFFEFLVTYPPHKEALFWVGGNHRTRWIEW